MTRPLYQRSPRGSPVSIWWYCGGGHKKHESCCPHPTGSGAEFADKIDTCFEVLLWRSDAIILLPVVFLSTRDSLCGQINRFRVLSWVVSLDLSVSVSPCSPFKRPFSLPSWRLISLLRALPRVRQVFPLMEIRIVSSSAAMFSHVLRTFPAIKLLQFCKFSLFEPRWALWLVGSDGGARESSRGDDVPQPNDQSFSALHSVKASFGVHRLVSEWLCLRTSKKKRLG